MKNETITIQVQPGSRVHRLIVKSAKLPAHVEVSHEQIGLEILDGYVEAFEDDAETREFLAMRALKRMVALRKPIKKAAARA